MSCEHNYIHGVCRKCFQRPEEEPKEVPAPEEVWISRMARALLTIQAARRGVKTGQMCTEFTCALCDDECGHPNTATPYMCKPCEDRLREMVL